MEKMEKKNFLRSATLVATLLFFLSTTTLAQVPFGTAGNRCAKCPGAASRVYVPLAASAQTTRQIAQSGVTAHLDHILGGTTRSVGPVTIDTLWMSGINEAGEPQWVCLYKTATNPPKNHQPVVMVDLQFLQDTTVWEVAEALPLTPTDFMDGVGKMATEEALATTLIMRDSRPALAAAGAFTLTVMGLGLREYVRGVVEGYGTATTAAVGITAGTLLAQELDEKERQELDDIWNHALDNDLMRGLEEYSQEREPRGPKLSPDQVEAIIGFLVIGTAYYKGEQIMEGVKGSWSQVMEVSRWLRRSGEESWVKLGSTLRAFLGELDEVQIPSLSEARSNLVPPLLSYSGQGYDKGYFDRILVEQKEGAQILKKTLSGARVITTLACGSKEEEFKSFAETLQKYAPQAEFVGVDINAESKMITPKISVQNGDMLTHLVEAADESLPIVILGGMDDISVPEKGPNELYRLSLLANIARVVPSGGVVLCWPDLEAQMGGVTYDLGDFGFKKIPGPFPDEGFWVKV